MFDLVRVGSGSRKGVDNFSLDLAIININRGVIREIANQVSRLRFLFWAPYLGGFPKSFQIPLPTAIRSLSGIPGCPSKYWNPARFSSVKQMSYGLSYRESFLKAKAQVTDFEKYPKDAAWDPIGVDLRLEKHLHLRPYTHNSSSGSFQKETNRRIPLGPRQRHLSRG